MKCTFADQPFTVETISTLNVVENPGVVLLIRSWDKNPLSNNRLQDSKNRSIHRVDSVSSGGERSLHGSAIPLGLALAVNES